jgi:glucose/arabinose dehydrogenase
LEVQVTELWTPVDRAKISVGWARQVSVRGVPADYQAWFRDPNPPQVFGEPDFVSYGPAAEPPLTDWVMTAIRLGGGTGRFGYLTDTEPTIIAAASPVPLPVTPESVTVVPGFEGTRLPLPRSIMPTAITWTEKGRLAFTSLKGHVFVAKDTDSDGLEDQLTTFAEGLAAPFGILPTEETQGSLSLGFLVAHKPEVLSLRDTDGDDRSDTAKVIASGWGYTDDYHDWTTGIVRDDRGPWHYIGLGSDYAHKNRPADQSKWRGRILRFNLQGQVESVASELRYPVGLTITEDDKLFCSDQQGVQNCFNELNYIQLGHRYGVPAKNDPKTEAPADVAAVEVPHPWTRSVNGIAFWPKWTGHPYAGQIVGAEFNNRALVRFSLQTVDGHVQGAVYPLSKFSESTGPENFLGPIAVAFNAKGELYVGSLYDSGWLGGLNVGDIVKLTPQPETLPNGIREVRAIPGGFAIEFLTPVDRAKAEVGASYRLSGYTRVWGGEYATPDSGRHTADVRAAKLSADGRTVELVVSGLKAGHVYDVSVGEVDAALWPNLAHYTLTKLPR